MNPIYLVALACPIGMGLMMFLMSKGMMGGSKHGAATDISEPRPADPDKQMAILQAQRQLLDAQIAAAEESATPSTAGETRR